MTKGNLGGDEFPILLGTCQELAGLFPEGIVFIGGIAVYLHAINHDESRPFAESTHDADFYISVADMGDLRDLEEVIPNRRLNKHQLTKHGFDFDIYTERHSALLVPYDQVIAHCAIYDGVRVAGLEHLTVLKLEAFRDRRASAKGAKDARDLIRIATISQATGMSFSGELAAGYLGEEHLALLDEIKRGPEFLALARGNAKEAKRLRLLFTTFAEAISQ